MVSKSLPPWGPDKLGLLISVARNTHSIPLGWNSIIYISNKFLCHFGALEWEITRFATYQFSKFSLFFMACASYHFLQESFLSILASLSPHHLGQSLFLLHQRTICINHSVLELYVGQSLLQVFRIWQVEIYKDSRSRVKNIRLNSQGKTWDAFLTKIKFVSLPRKYSKTVLCLIHLSTPVFWTLSVKL